MRMRLTKRAIDAIKPSQKRFDVWDSELPTSGSVCSRTAANPSSCAIVCEGWDGAHPSGS